MAHKKAEVVKFGGRQAVLDYDLVGRDAARGIMDYAKGGFLGLEDILKNPELLEKLKGGRAWWIDGNGRIPNDPGNYIIDSEEGRLACVSVEAYNRMNKEDPKRCVQVFGLDKTIALPSRFWVEWIDNQGWLFSFGMAEGIGRMICVENLKEAQRV